MAITTSNPDGVRVTTAAKNGTLGSQAAAAADEIIFDSAIGTNNGDLEASPTFVGRLVLVRQGAGDQEVRYITAIDGPGTTATLNADWDVAPVSSDTYHVSYRLADAETTGAQVNLNSKTGVFEFSRSLTIGNAGGGGAFAFFSITDYQAMEMDDSGSADDLIVEDNGRFDIGYIQAGAPIAGGIITNTKNADTEPYMLFNGGAIVNFNAPILWSQVVDTSFTMTDDNTNQVVIRGATFIKTASSAVFAKSTWLDVVWQGSGLAADTVTVTSGTVIDTFLLAATAGFTTADDSVTATLEIRNPTFVGNSTNVTVHNDKTWNIVNPVGWVADSTFITFPVDSANEVNLLGSLNITTQQADGTPLVASRVYVWDTVTDNLVHELDTAGDGTTATDVLLEKYTFPSSVFTTVTSGPFALKIFKHSFSPSVGAADPTGGLDLTITLVTDSNISETNATQAITDGAGITFTLNANPTSIIEFTGGAGTLSVGEVVTGQGSSAVGTVVQFETGDSSAGTIYLNTRNSNNFSNGETLDDGADWTGTYTASTQQDFTWEIDANAKSLQVLYDYHSAKLEEDVLDAIFEQVVEWGEASEGFMVIADGGDTWRTRRVDTEGVFVSDRGSGTVSLFTADDGTTFTPPQSFTFTVSNVEPDSEVRLFNDDGTSREGDESVLGVIQASPLIISNSGNGYTVNDKLTVQGGTFTIAGILNVDAESGGIITAVSVDTAGAYTKAPTSPVGVAGGTGSSAEFTIDVKGTFSHTYTFGGSDFETFLVVFHLNFKDFKTENTVLSNADQTFTVFQIPDRNYENPP